MIKLNKKLVTVLLVTCVITVGIYSTPVMETNSIDPFFTLTMKVYGTYWGDYANFVKQHAARIGINIEVILLDWPSLISEYLVYHDYDIIQGFIPSLELDANLEGIYNENGSLNIYGYTTEMDYNESLGTGTNEWYIQQGANMLPKYSQEKIDLFWEWQDYFMDDILALLPFFTYQKYQANWNNLEGYNSTEGILQSWGKMFWDGGHTGQQSLDELVISDYFVVDNLNPLFLVDSVGRSFIQDAILEPLFWVDPDKSIWPHLGSSWNHLNDSTVRVTVREGIKWQADIDGNFTTEYLDAKDVYFTFHCWKYLINDMRLFSPIKEMVLVDDYTIDFSFEYSDDDYYNYLDYFTLPILPEHYLNQTQQLDGITPDTTHLAWTKYQEHLFGTGLFELGAYTPQTELILSVFNDCWRMDESVTVDPTLNWVKRFGNFSDTIEQIRMKYQLERYVEILDFQSGHLDLLDNINNLDEISNGDFDVFINYDIHSEPGNIIGSIGFNLRSDRPVIGNNDPTRINPAMTVGLAVRKAIAYAIDLDEINSVIHNNELVRLYYPFTPENSIWANPNITKYDHDLDKARKMLNNIVPYTPTTSETNIDWIIPLGGLFCVLIAIVNIRRKKRQ